jgi:hypothetical protein
MQEENKEKEKQRVQDEEKDRLKYLIQQERYGD